MFTKIKTKQLLIVLTMFISSTFAKERQILISKKIADNITIVKSNDIKIHTYHGISNSHIIETENELRLIDAQFTLSSATKLKEYIKTLNKPLVQVLLSHNHPDHWFGSQVFVMV